MVTRFNDYIFFQSLQVYMCTSSLHCYSLYSFTTSSTNDVRVASGESAEAKEREGAKERELIMLSETAEQREEQLSTRRIRDRARCAVQSEEQREARLQQMRDRLGAATRMCLCLTPSRAQARPTTCPA